MHFFKSLLLGVGALAAAAGAVSSSLKFTSVPTNVETRHSYTITWVAPNDSPVTILLKQGPAGNLRTVQTLTTTGSGGSYVWSPGYNLVSNTNYALEIKQGNQINYSGTIILNAGRTPQQGSVVPKPKPMTTPVTPVSPSYVSPVMSYTTYTYGTTVIVSSCPYSSPVVTYTAPIATGTGTGYQIPRNTTFYSATIPSTYAPTTVAPTYPPPASSPAAPVYTTANAAGGLDAHIAMIFGAAAAVAALA